MIRKNHLAVCKFLALLAVILPLAAGMALAAEKKPLTYDAYAGWRSIRFTQLSRDGAWLAYALVAQEDDGELVVRNLRSDKEYRSPRGTQPAITADGKYVVFTVSPPQADVEKARKEKKKPAEQPKNGLGIMDLETGEVSTIDRVKNFKIAEDSGAFAAYLMEAPIKKPDEKKDAEEKATPRRKPAAKAEEAEKEGGKEEKKKEPGTELVIRNLATGEETKIPEVTEYLWNESGSWLAFAVSSETAEKDGAFAWHAATGNTVSLLEGLGHYKNLTFDEKGAQLAFVSDRDDYEADKPQFKLYYWKAPTAPAAELVPAAAKGFPEGMVVSEHGNLSFSKDGGRLFFGIARAPEPEPEDAPEPLKVDIWHWKDPHLQPMQKVRADRERRNSLMCVMHLGPKENKFVQLATEDVPQINLSDDGLLALGLSDLPYRQLISWDRGYNDVYLVSLSDGSKKKILEKSASRPMFSPGGKYVLFFEDGSDD